MTEPHPPAGPGPSPVCRAFLVKLGRTPDKERRRKILTACAKVGKTWAEELLWEALADPNESVRELVVRELCRREPLRFELALRRLRLPPWYARSAALGIVGRRRVREAVPDIVLASFDANADIRRAAAVALGELGGEEALPPLVRLKKDTNPFVRAAA